MREVVKVKRYSPKTLQCYRTWVRQFRGFLGEKPVGEVDPGDAARVLIYLAAERNVVASTRNHAFSALLFWSRSTGRVPSGLFLVRHSIKSQSSAAGASGASGAVYVQAG